MPDVIALARAQRAALERADAAILRRLVAAYGGIYARLADKLDALTAEVMAARAAGEPLTAGAIAKLARYKALTAQAEAELVKFSRQAGDAIAQTARAALQAAGADARALALASLGVATEWNSIRPDAIEALLGFLDPDGPLYARLAELAPTTADKVASKMLDALATGRNPRDWAGLLRDALGLGLTDALRMTRTVQLYAYREGARANYEANPNVVTGWYWFAELDDRVCLSCVALHGSLHPVSEVLNDHHNGRCAMLPAVVGGTPPVQPGDGQKWFESLSEADQRAMMGPGRHDAWTGGQFDFAALSGMYTDPVYGPMRAEASLRDLTAGAGPA